MKSKKKLNLNKFEKLTKDSHLLKGGFSVVIGANAPLEEAGVEPETNTCTNNCFGGNCTTGCGKK